MPAEFGYFTPPTVSAAAAIGGLSPGRVPSPAGGGSTGTIVAVSLAGLSLLTVAVVITSRKQRNGRNVRR